jgi:magnesium transporter
MARGNRSRLPIRILADPPVNRLIFSVWPAAGDGSRHEFFLGGSPQSYGNPLEKTALSPGVLWRLPMIDVPRWEDLQAKLQQILCEKEVDFASIGRLLQGYEPADIALALEEIDPDDAVSVFRTLEKETSATVLAMLAPGLTKAITGGLDQEEITQLADMLPNREAFALLLEQPDSEIQADQANLAPLRDEVSIRSQYAEGTAGRMMTTEFVRLSPTMTVDDALRKIRDTDPTADLPSDMFVVEDEETDGAARERLVGVMSIRDAIMNPGDVRISDIMTREVICVPASTEIAAATRFLSKYKFLALPVIDADGFLSGIIPTDDLMQITVSRLYERYAKTVGTDAAAMEKMSPAQAAKTRVPWLLGTMVIELGAAVIITHFNDILKQVILLASFMPVISAISGNVGLQAAAITVRGLDAGDIASGKSALIKEGMTTLLMATICGVVLGLIGGIWSRHLMFGVVIGLALTSSMLTAAVMGTLFPMVSKKLGFDPATTAGPFETAFQDVIGFGVFLGLATLFAGQL